MGRRKYITANLVWEWIQKVPLIVKIPVGLLITLILVAVIKSYISNYYNLFVIAESIHAEGLLILLYKLFTKKTCSGISLKSQEVTAIYLVARIVSGVHTIVDLATLVLTLLVVYMIRFKLKETYSNELDNLPRYYVLIPCAVLAALVHPNVSNLYGETVVWAFCVYLEAVSVLPQLLLMQNATMVEPLTAHYVFALGMSRFLGCAYWIIMLINTRGKYLYFAGFGRIWMWINFIAEMVQTFILVDFCYYYVKSGVDGQNTVLPLHA